MAFNNTPSGMVAFQQKYVDYVNGISSVNGVASIIDVNGHLMRTQLNPPTVVVGAGAGTGSATLVAGSTDQKGQVSLVVTTSAVGILCTITLGSQYGTNSTAVFPTWSSSSTTASTGGQYINCTGANSSGSTTITFNNSSTSLANGTYILTYSL